MKPGGKTPTHIFDSYISLESNFEDLEEFEECEGWGRGEGGEGRGVGKGGGGGWGVVSEE
jgi:hypothetical protein